MRMKIFYLIFALIPFSCLGQKQGNIWYFGDHAGLDFNSGVPNFISGGQTYFCDGYHNEGTSVICDSNGSLLFYSNGEKVWNRNHQVMPNGDGFMGNASSTQAALIVPLPSSNRYFYLFTTDAFACNGNLTNGLRYSIIDMCLDDNLGDVVTNQKNILILDTVAEKLTAVKHANGTDYWIVTHKYWSDAFYSFRLTSAGIADTVISHIGSVHQDIWIPTSIASAIGQLKISPNGSRLAVCFSNTNPGVSELFDFNISTGIVTNFISLPGDANSGNLYGVEFSPNNSKLYFTGGYSGLYQYNLIAGGGNADSIRNSKTLISQPIDYLFGLQLGPDGKIYIAKYNVPFLAEISNPNADGSACNYIDNAISLNGNNCAYGITGFITNYDYSNNIVDCSSGVSGNHIIKNFNIYPNPTNENAILEFENSNKENCTLRLYDRHGQPVRTIINIRSDKVEIDRQNLQSGLYFFQLQTDKQIIATGKLTIE